MGDFRIINGQIDLAGGYTLPSTDGTSNQVMTSNGAGVASWKTLHLSNANTTDVTANATDTYLTGSALTIGGKIKAGTVIIFRGHMTKSAAGIATPIFNVRFGTNGTTADTARLTFTGVAQTATTDTGWFELRVVIRSVSATSTANGGLNFEHFNTTTGLANKAQAQIIQTTSASFDNTSASLIIGLSVNPGASGVWRFQMVSTEAYNLL